MMGATPEGPAGYRPDIDGLRALAVLSVVAYHAVEPLVPGGFVGVDIFFVISGYLITQLLARDLQRSRFSIAQFYVRRSKRILPALSASVLATMLLGLVLLTPDELASFGRDMAATYGFASNVTLWRRLDYFAPAAERIPLLHTWSLAVEEQFYVIWPLLIAALWKLANPRPVVHAALWLAFGLSCIAVVVEPSAAFFLLPARAWELLVGAALALSVPRVEVGRLMRAVLATGGLALIAVALAWLDRTSRFPGWNALLPCLGTALLIVAGSGLSNAISERVLAHRVLVFVGLISYSLYLWHWPLLSLARISRHGMLTTPQTLVVVATAIGVAALCWRFVEQPFRARNSTSASAPLLRYAALSAVGILAGGGLAYSGGLVRFADSEVVQIERARRDTNERSGPCLRTQGRSGPLPSESCLSGDHNAPQLVIWGDSHADALAPGVVEFGKRHGQAIYQLTMIACPPLPGIRVVDDHRTYENCNAFNDQALEYILAQPLVRSVFLAARWTLYAQNARFGPDDRGPATYLTDASSDERTTRNSSRVLAAGLEQVVTRLEDAGKRVIVFGSVPPVGHNVPSCLARNLMPFSSAVDCGVPESVIVAQLEPVDTWLAQIGDRHGKVCTFFPRRSLCDGQRCRVTEGDAVLYADDDHLTRTGARYLLERFDSEGEGCGAAWHGRREAP